MADIEILRYLATKTGLGLNYLSKDEKISIILEQIRVTTQSIVVRKECFKKVGMFDESLPRLQDWELVIRLSKYYDFKCIDEPLLISSYILDSISANNAALIKALKLILSKHFNDFAEDKNLLSKHYFRIGVNLCSRGDFEEGRNHLIKAIKTHPLNIKYLLVTFLSFFGQGVYNKAVEGYRRVRNGVNCTVKK